ncbi:MAG: HAMP domain-containing protein [Verrucomicrobia bacterium]|nr:HAMP domain-containing protein [Verrucomicrobiota bacterium]
MLPGLHSLHWKVFLFHLAVLLIPVGYLAWQVRQNLETTTLRTTEDGMIDTATIVAELYQRVAKEAELDPPRMKEVLASIFADFEGTRATRAKLFNFSRDDADTRLIFYDRTGALLHDTQRHGDASPGLDVQRALRGRYGSRWELDGKSGTVNLYSTVPVWLDGDLIGAVSMVKPTVSSRRLIVRALRDLILPGLAAVAAATLMAYLLSGYVTGIVADLASRADRIAKGESGVELSTWTRSELGVLARAVERMRRALEGKEYVAETVTHLSHELKTPLAAIRGAAELLEDGAVADPAARAKFLGSIQAEAGRLSRLVDDLLQLARVESAPAAAVPAPLELCAAVRELCDQVHRPRAEQLSLRLVCETRGEAHGRIERATLELMLGNLVANALQFTPAGRSVTISAGVSDEPGRIELRVRDEGPGIEPALQGRVFERFFTTVNPRTGQRGTGLGLTLVRTLAERHRGSVTVHSEPGAGAEFVVTLPDAYVASVYARRGATE